MRWILILGWMAVLIFILPVFIRSLFKTTSPKETIEKGADMVLDEVCRVYVPKARAKQVKWKGKEVYFCSQACEEKFLARPGEI